jgi:hypothetical protein
MKLFDKDLITLKKLNEVNLELNYKLDTDFEENTPKLSDNLTLKEILQKSTYITEKMNTSVLSNKNTLYSNNDIVSEINHNTNKNDIYFYKRSNDRIDSTNTVMYSMNPMIKLDKLLTRINKFNTKLITNYNKKKNKNTINFTNSNINNDDKISLNLSRKISNQQENYYILTSKAESQENIENSNRIKKEYYENRQYATNSINFSKNTKELLKKQEKIAEHNKIEHEIKERKMKHQQELRKGCSVNLINNVKGGFISNAGFKKVKFTESILIANKDTTNDNISFFSKIKYNLGSKTLTLPLMSLNKNQKRTNNNFVSIVSDYFPNLKLNGINRY